MRHFAGCRCSLCGALPNVLCAGVMVGLVWVLSGGCYSCEQARQYTPSLPCSINFAMLEENIDKNAKTPIDVSEHRRLI